MVSMASTAARCRWPKASRWRGPTSTCSEYLLWRLLQHRRGALDSRHPLQHEHDGDAARQSDLWSDQETGVADLAPRNEEQHHAARQLSRSAAAVDGDARRPERVLRRAS